MGVVAAGAWVLVPRAPVVDEALTRPAGDTTVPPPDGVPATILAAGDIADCDGGAAATAALVERMDGVVAALGDLAYEDGTAQDFDDCYLPTWGRFVDRTRPALGNHDVRTAGASAYFDVFGAAAGPEPQGYYSYTLGDWQVVVLHSNCPQVGGCDTDSPQVRWLRDTLAAATTGNILAYWHHPRWSTGRHGDRAEMDVVWRVLADAGADVVLTGHDHGYQRFEPLDADGRPDPSGVRQFVAGTGGTELRSFDHDDPRVEFRQDSDLGVLELDLDSCGYRWRFHTVDGDVIDEGRSSGTC